MQQIWAVGGDAYDYSHLCTVCFYGILQYMIVQEIQSNPAAQKPRPRPLRYVRRISQDQSHKLTFPALLGMANSHGSPRGIRHGNLPCSLPVHGHG